MFYLFKLTSDSIFAIMSSRSERGRRMNWEEYKEQVKSSDKEAKKIIEEAEEEAKIVSSLIQQRVALGLSQRDLASLCDIPQSSVARIESYKTTPRLDTVLKLLNEMGLTLSVTKLRKPKP